MDKSFFKPGDVVSKESFPEWHDWLMKIIYWGIKKYQFEKWGKNWRAVHVYIVLPAPYTMILKHGKGDVTVRAGQPVLFEQTHPVAKWTPIEYLSDKTFAINEWTEGTLEVNPMLTMAEQYDGKKYDFYDLVDFAFSGFVLGTYRVVRILGDKAKRLGVCSTVVARILQSGGCSSITKPNDITPAYFEGNGPGWVIRHRFNFGKPVGIGDKI